MTVLDETLSAGDINHVETHEALAIQHNLYEGLTPATFAAAIHAHSGLVVVRTADLAVPSGTTLADISGLVLALEASSTYLIELGVIFVTGTTGFKFAVTLPAGATISGVVARHNSVDGSATAIYATPGGSSLGTNTTVSAGRSVLTAAVVTSSAGNMQAQHAHNNGSSTGATLKAGSWMTAMKV